MPYYDTWTVLSMALFVLTLIFSLWAQMRVKSTFKKYEKQASRRGITAAQVARHILDANGLNQVPVEPIPGELSDHYDPRDRVLRLSSPVFGSTSVAAIGVAAHEAGHAVQHAHHYGPLMVRNAIVPVTNFGSRAAIPLLLVGLGLTYISPSLIWIAYLGLLCYSLAFVFQLVTLPTEFDASRRALSAISQYNILQPDEITGARKVLWAAAMTYIAALAATAVQLLRFALIVLSRGGGRRN